MTPIFDREGEHVGWASGDWENVFDKDMRWVSEGFETRSDVHAVAEDVVAVDDDIPDIDTDAEGDPLLDRQTGLTGGHAALHVERASHGIDRACELDQHPVTGRLDDAPTMLGDFRIDKLPSARLQLGERAFFICAHEAAISRDIRREDGRQPPLDAFVGQEAPFERLGLGTIGPKSLEPSSHPCASEDIEGRQWPSRTCSPGSATPITAMPIDKTPADPTGIDPLRWFVITALDAQVQTRRHIPLLPCPAQRIS
jgi:hypothetical protein